MVVDAGTTTYDGATGLWTYPGSATYASAAPVVLVGSGAGNAALRVLGVDTEILSGSGTGSPNIILDKVAAGAASLWYRVGGVNRWQVAADATPNLAINRYNAAGAFQDQTSVSAAAHLWTYPGSATYASASPIVSIGIGTGSPITLYNKSDAGQATIAQIQNVGVDTWVLACIVSEDFYVSRFNGAGVFQDATVIGFANHLWTYPANALYDSAAATVTVGSGGGAAQIILNQSADEVGSIEIQNASATLNAIYFGAGAPAGVVNNGDFYFRMDNTGAGSAIYKYVGGAWANVA
jgi:hypothetical protein